METEYGTSEYIMGAACGYFWRSHCAGDGVPNGYSVMTVSGTEITDAYFKGTGHSRDYQLRLYRGTTFRQRTSLLYLRDGQRRHTCQRIFRGHGRQMENRGIRGRGTFRRNGENGSFHRRSLDQGIPHRGKSFPKKSASAPCHHLFSYKLKNPDAKVVVRATDPFGNTYTQNRITRAGDYGDATGEFLQCPAD